MTDEQKPEAGEPESEAELIAPEDSAPEPAEESFAPPSPAHLERLQKILAQAGVASRRAAEQLITEGRVQVNGQIVTELGTKADPGRDHIRVDGKLLHGAERLRYFMLNKPRGYVTTVKDPEGRPTVMEFFAKTGERLYPVGRLDYLSEGLLLITNDGPLANALTRAASGVEKTYLVKVAGEPSEEMIEQLRSGVAIDRGRRGEGRVQTAPARVRQVRSGNNPWFEVVLIEGRNRELRKMFEEIGHHVEKIRRVGYGPLVLDIEPGKMRELEPVEVEALRLTAAGKLKPRRMKSTRMLPKDAGLTAEERSAKAERAARFKRGGRPFAQGGHAAGRGFKPSFNPRSGSGPGTQFRSRPDARPGFKSGFQPGFKAKPSGEEAPERRRKVSGADSGFERPFRGDRPARPSTGRSRTGRPGTGRPGTGRPADGSSRPFKSKPFGKPGFGERGKSFGKPQGKTFSKPAFGERGDRPARPESDRPRTSRPTTGRPADGSSRPFKSKPFGKPGFGERGKSFGKPQGKPGFGERGDRPARPASDRPRTSRPADGSTRPFKSKPFGKPSFGKSGSGKPGSGKPGSGERGKSFGKPASGAGRGKPYGKATGGPGRGKGKGPFRPGGKPKGR